MAGIFTKRNISDDTMLGKLRNPYEFYNFENPRTTLGPKIWNILPNDIILLYYLLAMLNK